MNRRAWLSAATAYGAAFVTSAVVAEGAVGQTSATPEVLGVGAVSTSVFGLFTAGILFAHRKLAPLSSVVAGAAVGAIAYAGTWMIWHFTAPTFRHAVPFELLPLLVFPSVLGLLVSVAFYFTSLDHAA